MNSPPVPRRQRNLADLAVRVGAAVSPSSDTGSEKFPNLFPSREMGKPGQPAASQEISQPHIWILQVLGKSEHRLGSARPACTSGGLAELAAPDCAAICSLALCRTWGHHGLDPGQATELGATSGLTKRRPRVGRKLKRRGLEGMGRALGRRWGTTLLTGGPCTLPWQDAGGGFSGASSGAKQWPGPGMKMKLEGTGL